MVNVTSSCPSAGPKDGRSSTSFDLTSVSKGSASDMFFAVECDV